MNQPSSSKARRTFVTTLKSARIGFVEAQYEVGLMFANGIGAPQDLEQAILWIRKAAERGFTAAQYLLGTRYLSGTAVEKDEHQAFFWLLKASEQGHPKAFLKLARLHEKVHPEAAAACLTRSAEFGVAEAQFALGQAYADGKGVTQSYLQAHAWFLRAAEQGFAVAQFAVAELNANGQGVVQDLEQAIGWYRQAAAQYYPAAQVAMARLEGAGMVAPVVSSRRKAHAREQAVDVSGWEHAAESGDADFKYHLGLMYQNGFGLPQDLGRAQDWFVRAARLGHVRAQLALAKLLEASQDFAAQNWYQRAAEQGDREAQFALGRIFSSAPEGERDLFTGMAWYVKAGQQGSPLALLTLGHLFSGNLNEIAVASFEKAAEQGAAEAQYLLGQRYARGDGVRKSTRWAFDWYQRAAEQGYAPAQCALGVCYLSGTGTPVDVGMAVTCFRLAAEQGDAKAQWNLGSVYAGGGPGVKKDLKSAFVWCQKSADLGFAPAQATLGLLFARIKNFEEAVRCWTLAAEQGDPEAQYNLALMLAKGQGVPQDWQLAFHWFVAAAEQGIVSAQSRLGLMYATGDAVAKDPIEAHKWFVIAAKSGDVAANSNLIFSQAQLGLMQIAEAQRRATVWRAQQGSD